MLVVAHMWAHARAADEVLFAPVGSLVYEHGHDHDHLADHAHGGTFLLPVAKVAFLKAMPLLVALPTAVLPPATEPHVRPPEHVPKCGHRERAVRNHTLEVYRP
ncbi:hypothetical protein ACTWPT_40680 [Nonomuraea sp. 3N208]